jgi:hypothetical protein
MATEYRKTQEEEAFERLLDEKRDLLSEDALKLVGTAQYEAYKYNFIKDYTYQPFEYFMGMEDMVRLIESRAAAQECEEIWVESVRKYDLRHAKEQRGAWCAYHRHMVGVHESSAQEHREKLGRLIDLGAAENGGRAVE